MANLKFSVTLGKKQIETIRKAASILQINMSDIIRIGAYRFAILVDEGKIDEEILEYLGKDIK